MDTFCKLSGLDPLWVSGLWDGTVTSRDPLLKYSEQTLGLVVFGLLLWIRVRLWTMFS